MTYHYTVEVYKIGSLLAEIHTTGTDALAAIWNAEGMVKAEKVKAGKLTEQDNVKKEKFWNGLEFVARRGAAA